MDIAKACFEVGNDEVGKNEVRRLRLQYNLEATESQLKDLIAVTIA